MSCANPGPTPCTRGTAFLSENIRSLPSAVTKQAGDHLGGTVAALDHRPDGRQDCRPKRLMVSANTACADAAGSSELGAGDGRHGGGGTSSRLPGAGQSVRGRRRRRRYAASSSVTRRTWPSGRCQRARVDGGARRSAMPKPSILERWLERPRVTSRSRSSATCTATSCHLFRARMLDSAAAPEGHRGGAIAGGLSPGSCANVWVLADEMADTMRSP